MTTSAGIYARVSTSDQDVQRQLDEANEWLESTYDEPEVETYPDVITGTSEGTERDEYDRLLDDIEDGELEVVVVHEISRLSRLGGAEVQKFIQHCLENDTSVKDLEVGLEIRVEDSELQQTIFKMIASLMGDLAKIEHKQKMRRIRSGIRAAQEQGKWTGRPPKGFTTDKNKRLRVDIEEYLTVQQALERIDSGEHPKDVADDTGLSRSTLDNLYKNKQELYLRGEAEDERVQEAVEESKRLKL